MRLIYEKVCRDFDFDGLKNHFYKSYQMVDFGDDIPHSGIFMGSISGANWIRENRPEVKLWASFENFLCSSYYPLVSDLLFNDKYAFIPFKELGRRKWDLYSWLGKESYVFIRPDSGEKDFPAELVDLKYIDKLVDNYDYTGLAVVSTPKNLIGEWRFVVKDKKVHAVSSYRYQGVLTKIPSAPRGAYDLVDKVVERVEPDEIFCIDVVQDTGQEFWVMELTSFSSAGLYACDHEKIAKMLMENT